jgi:hypothetical protein
VDKKIEGIQIIGKGVVLYEKGYCSRKRKASGRICLLRKQPPSKHMEEKSIEHKNGKFRIYGKDSHGSDAS